ncbi:MAG: hypothetical protein JWO41_614 [Candidatus Saccharibacteria bacterium]|nr:hypothetical protein [Candidatus Saccharibacteria bacterium]
MTTEKTNVVVPVQRARSWEGQSTSHHRGTGEDIVRHTLGERVIRWYDEQQASKTDLETHIASEIEYAGSTPLANTLELAARHVGVKLLQLTKAVLG